MIFNKLQLFLLQIMLSILKICGINKEKSIVLELTRTGTIEGSMVVNLTQGEVYEINDFDLYPLVVIARGRASSATNTFEAGSFVDQQIYQKALKMEENTTILKLQPQLADDYLQELRIMYRELNCILQTIYNMEINITDKNCIQIVRMIPGKTLIQEHKTNKYFYILLEGSCNIKRLFNSATTKEQASVDIYSFKNYYLLGEEALYYESSPQKVVCTSECYFMKINAERFSRHIPLNIYTNLKTKYKNKNNRTISTHLGQVKGKTENRTKAVNPQDIIDYFERGNKINNHKIFRQKEKYHNIGILQKFCQRNQQISTDYMNYFVQSTEQKIRFELISKGYNKPEPDISARTGSVFSQQQMRKILKKKVLNQLRTKGRNMQNSQIRMSFRSRLKPQKKI